MARRAVALPALDGLFLAAFLDPWGCPAGNLFCFNSHPGASQRGDSNSSSAYAWKRSDGPVASAASQTTINALRAYSRVLLAGSNLALSLRSQVGGGGDCWLLMVVRGHLGDMPAASL
jgi:hypothetical protein